MSKPQKRHPALIPLSQDHHFGLLLVWKIRQGLSRQVDHQRIFNYVDYFVNTHLEVHFQQEEEHLFSYLAKNDQLRKEAEAQHAQLRQLFQSLADKDKVQEEGLLEYADSLESHIRFEERKLFPYMQVEMTHDDLQEFQQKMEMVHDKVQEHWEDEFWVKNL
ncbi:MAG TPA: hemerythrin domain-containing protein [Cyclobacteriaceae bacterium]|nr:hemerythrin domain-containing protein [Cyclobacteriaceae bacterium]